MDLWVVARLALVRRLYTLLDFKKIVVFFFFFYNEYVLLL